MAKGKKAKGDPFEGLTPVNTELTPVNVSDNQVDTYHKGIPKEVIIGLYVEGMSQSDIARKLGCSRANISDRLAPFKESLDALPAFKRHKADLLALQQREILNSLTPEDIKGQSAYQRVGMLSILYDKERLERDQSTENISIDAVVKNVDELRAELAKIDNSDG